MPDVFDQVAAGGAQPKKPPATGTGDVFDQLQPTPTDLANRALAPQGLSVSAPKPPGVPDDSAPLQAPVPARRRPGKAPFATPQEDELANEAEGRILDAANQHIAQPVTAAVQGVNDALADIPQQIVHPPEIDPQHPYLSRIRPAVKVGADVVSAASAPFSVALAPAEPIVQPWSNLGGNLAKAVGGGPEGVRQARDAGFNELVSNPQAVHANEFFDPLNQQIGAQLPFAAAGAIEGLAPEGPASIEKAAAQTARPLPKVEPVEKVKDTSATKSVPKMSESAGAGDVFDRVAAAQEGPEPEPQTGTPPASSRPAAPVTPGQEPAVAREEPGAGAAPKPVASGQVVRIPIDQVSTDTSKFQPRQGLNEGRVTAIADNMRRRGAFGDQEPIDLYPKPDGSGYDVLAGHHRFEAAQRAGLDEVTARIHSDLTPDDAQDFARRSNSKAAVLTPMEYARAFEVEQAKGHSSEEIGKLYGDMKEGQVSDLLHLNSLARPLQDLVQDGHFDPAKAIALAKATEKYNIPPEVQQQAFDYVVKRRDITPAQFGRLLDTFAPAAAKQMTLEGGLFEHQGFAGLTSAMDEYNDKLGQLSTSQRRLTGFVKEIERRQRQGEQVPKATLQTKNSMEREVRRLRQQIEQMQADAGSGKLYKTIGQAIAEGQQEAGEPTVQSPMLAGEPSIPGEKEEVPSPEDLEAEGQGRLLARRRGPNVTPPSEVLPGFEGALEEHQRGVEEKVGEDLTQQLVRPPEETISRKAGEMERESPLFRAAGASEQGEMFAPEEEAAEPEPQGGLFQSRLPSVRPPDANGPNGPNESNGANESFAHQAAAAAPNFAQPASWAHAFPVGGVASGAADLTAGDAMKGIIRAREGERALKMQQLHAQLEKHEKTWEKRSAAESLDFIDAIETGAGRKGPATAMLHLKDPEQAQLAAGLAKMLDDRRKLIQNLDHGQALSKFITDYFPHIWEKARKAEAVFRDILASKRPLEGGKSFLKQRTIPTTREGVNQGLKPITWNPVKLALLKAAEMDRYIAAHRMMGDAFKFEDDAGNPRPMAKNVMVGQQPPKAWKRLDDRMGTIFGNPNIPIEEYFDQGVWDQLGKLEKNLGINHERPVSLGRGYGSGTMGYSVQGQPIIKSKFATPLDVRLHEIGHQIDRMYGLDKQLVKDPKYKQELRDLADLRFEGTPSAMVDPNFRSYVRTGPEKMAAMFEAWLFAKEKFKATAPQTFKFLNQFARAHPELKPLLDMQPGLVKGMNTATVHAGGAVVRGHVYMPIEAANAFNRFLSPGLKGDWRYNAVRYASNAINQAQLGLSAFHLGFTSYDTMVSELALGLEKASRGNIPGAIGSIARIPTAPVGTYMLGSRILQEALRPGTHPELAMMTKAVAEAGGRLGQDPFWSNDASRAFTRALKSHDVGQAALRAFPAALEKMAGPIMGHIVPRQKLGVFGRMAQDVLARADDQGWSSAKRRLELQKAWDSVDNRLGQVVYDNLFWHRTFKDLAMISVRSVGWNLGTVRELGGGVKDVGGLMRRGEVSHRLAYSVALPVMSALTAATFQYAMTGKGPQELKDYFFPKTGEKDAEGRDQRVSQPNYIKQLYELYKDPLGTVTSKINPLLSATYEMLSNKDFYGTEIRNPDASALEQTGEVLKFIAEQFVPFSFRNAYKRAENQGAEGIAGPFEGKSLKSTAESFVGLTPAPGRVNKSDAENIVSDYLNRYAPAGSRPAEQVERTKAVRDAERGLRLKQISVDDLRQMVKDGKLTMPEAQRAYKYTAHGGDALTRGFGSSNLPLNVALKAWNEATPEEREKLRPLLVRKGRTLKNYLPEERDRLKAQLYEALGRQQEPRVEAPTTASSTSYQP